TISPITPGAVAKDGSLPSTMHSHPIYQYFAYSAWRNASSTDYVVLPLQVKLLDVDGTGTSVYADRDVYLADLSLSNDTSVQKSDLTSALRVHFAATTNQLYSLNGDTLTVGDYLDLNGDGKYDKSVGYEDFQDTTITKYGDDTGVLASYKANGTKNSADTPMANDSAADLVTDNAIALGKTDSNGVLSIKVTIWLEGWSELDAEAAVIDTLTQEELNGLTGMAKGDTYKVSDDSKVYRYDGSSWNEVTTDSVWDASSYIGSKFNVGMRFVVDAL
nr:hypothetical protein [Bacilli bacterium]